MESKIFQEIPEEQREAMLEANAYTVEEQELEKHFSQDEIVEMCKAYGYRYSERLHIVIWNKKTGV